MVLSSLQSLEAYPSASQVRATRSFSSPSNCESHSPQSCSPGISWNTWRTRCLVIALANRSTTPCNGSSRPTPRNTTGTSPLSTLFTKTKGSFAVRVAHPVGPNILRKPIDWPHRRQENRRSVTSTGGLNAPTKPYNSGCLNPSTRAANPPIDTPTIARRSTTRPCSASAIKSRVRKSSYRSCGRPTEFRKYEL